MNFSAKQFIQKHNQAYEQGKVSFQVGENHIADLVSEIVENVNIEKIKAIKLIFFLFSFQSHSTSTGS